MHDQWSAIWDECKIVAENLEDTEPEILNAKMPYTKKEKGIAVAEKSNLRYIHI